MSKLKSKYAVTAQKTSRIDLGLAISGATLEPGKIRTLSEIAAYCGCHRNAIWLIEQKALKKLRHPSKLRKLQ